MSVSSAARPQVTVIVPVRNGAATIESCLAPLLKDGLATEVIVVDDGSTDASADIARSLGAHVLENPIGRGPAAARNEGARHASGDILLFVDADIIVRPSTIEHVADVFRADPELAAVFGSYDDEPHATNFLSQYKNLFHHFTHQTSRTDSGSFWAGCGAIRRDVFRAAGAFDAREYERPATEDIELGWRLSRAGFRVRLDPDLQVKHLKEWTTVSFLKTDILDRAYPWSMLVLANDAIPDDLNLRLSHRLSAVLVAVVALTLPFLFAGRLRVFGVHTSPIAMGSAAVALLAILLLNRAFYAFLFRARGLWFALRAVPIHLLYYFYSGLTFVSCWALIQLRRARGPRRDRQTSAVPDHL